MSEMRTVALIGAGTMGLGIAHVAALAGYEVALYDVDEGQLERAMARIRDNLMKGVERGKVEPGAAEAALARIRPLTDLTAALADADLVIEAVPEDLELKRQIFARADELAPRHAILATNTTGLSISAIGAATGRPDKVIGLHFFNPVHIMRLVEVVRSETTSDATYAAASAACLVMGKETVEVHESPGFVTSRMNALIGAEAFRMWEEGVAGPEDIDKALKLGLKHPMGPFEMVDLVGLDVRLASTKNLHATLGRAFRPSLLLEGLVAAGRLGRKSGRGVYRYDGGKRVPGSGALPGEGDDD